MYSVTDGGASGAVGLMRSSRMKVVIIGCVITIFPFNEPAIFASESAEMPAISTGVPTMSPFVDGDHASG